MSKNSLFHTGVNTFQNAPSEYAIELLQDDTEAGLLTVVYGLQIKGGLTYTQACFELGACIIHDAACRGLVNNDGDY